jgi:predicted signal transduction protein with EAL and GGDEF domain
MAQARRRVELGCDVTQGYHLSRPLPAGELAAWMKSRQPAGSAPAGSAPAGSAPAGRAPAG